MTFSKNDLPKCACGWIGLTLAHLEAHRQHGCQLSSNLVTRLRCMADSEAPWYVGDVETAQALLSEAADVLERRPVETADLRRYVHEQLGPLCDDDNRPAEALVRLAAERLKLETDEGEPVISGAYCGKHGASRHVLYCIDCAAEKAYEKRTGPRPAACKCNPAGYAPDNYPAICSAYVHWEDEDRCRRCEHDQACHADPREECPAGGLHSYKGLGEGKGSMCWRCRKLVDDEGNAVSEGG
jgi:hypothetical protein